jgi:hypothetical protein
MKIPESQFYSLLQPHAEILDSKVKPQTFRTQVRKLMERGTYSGLEAGEGI